MMLLVLAGLQAQPKDVLEAASDGRRRLVADLPLDHPAAAAPVHRARRAARRHLRGQHVRPDLPHDRRRARVRPAPTCRSTSTSGRSSGSTSGRQRPWASSWSSPPSSLPASRCASSSAASTQRTRAVATTLTPAPPPCHRPKRRPGARTAPAYRRSLLTALTWVIGARLLRSRALDGHDRLQAGERMLRPTRPRSSSSPPWTSSGRAGVRCRRLLRQFR